MRARWAPPKSRSKEATGHLVDLIYAPFIVIGEEKRKERELSISQRKSCKTLFKQWHATVDLPSVSMQMHPMHRTGTMYKRMQSSATYMRIGPAAYHRAQRGIPLLQNSCRFEPTWSASSAMCGPPITIALMDDAVPHRVNGARPIPLAYQDSIKMQLDGMVGDGIIEPVSGQTE